MSTKITWLGHGTFEIQTVGMTLLIDPFLTGNPSASTTAAAVKPDANLITHGHGDHVGDADEIARRTGAGCSA
ncbi:MAG: MBL fold metallo-hydrolase, partial [Planctomycetaceae bacterium]